MTVSNSEHLVRRAEGTLVQRKGLMALIAFGVVWLCEVMLWRHLNPGALDPGLFTALRTTGMGLVFAGILGNVIILRRIQTTPGLKALVEDERAALTRQRMFFYGYFVLMVGIVACTLLNVSGVLDAKSLLLVLLAVGGVTPPVLFIFTR